MKRDNRTKMITQSGNSKSGLTRLQNDFS